MKHSLIMLGVLSATIYVGNVFEGKKHLSPVASDPILTRQLDVMQAAKGEQLTIQDTLKAVVSQYAVITDIGARQLDKHNADAERLIKKLDSAIQTKNSNVPNK